MSAVRVSIGILLIFAAVGFLLFSLIPAMTDDSQFVLDIFEPIYCGAGEQLSAERVVGRTSDGGVGMTAYYTCMRPNESTYDATGKMFLITGGVFTALLLLGIALLVFARRSADSAVYAGGAPVRYVTVSVQDASGGAPASAPEDLFDLPLNANPPAAAPDLQEKLRQLQEAYDHQLISRDEYDRKRTEILSEF